MFIRRGETSYPLCTLEVTPHVRNWSRSSAHFDILLLQVGYWLLAIYINHIYKLCIYIKYYTKLPTLAGLPSCDRLPDLGSILYPTEISVVFIMPLPSSLKLPLELSSPRLYLRISKSPTMSTRGPPSGSAIS